MRLVTHPNRTNRMVTAPRFCCSVKAGRPKAAMIARERVTGTMYRVWR